MRATIDPFTLVDISIGVVVSSSPVLHIPIPIAFVLISVRIVVGAMASSSIFLPLAIVSGLINIDELPRPMLLVLLPFSIICTAIGIVNLTRTLPASVPLFAEIDSPVRQSNRRYDCRTWVKLRFDHSALSEVIEPMSAALIFKECTLEKISILETVFPLTMLQAIFEPALEEKIIISV